MRYFLLLLPLLLCAEPPQQIVVDSNATVKTGKVPVRFKIKSDAFLMRPHSEARFDAKGFHLIKGGILSVFGKGERTLRTKTATMGIRGTGLYLEADSHGTYFCDCYGTIDLYKNGDGDPILHETLVSHHHNARRIDTDGEGLIVRRGVLYNHSDAELRLLEAMVGRTVPFD